MGHPKLKTADNILTPDFPRNPQKSGRMTEGEDLAAARIARRFAPNVQPPVAPGARSLDRPAQQPSATPKRRALIAGLVIAALLPSLVVGAIWLRSAGMLPMTANAGAIEIAPIQIASFAGAALPVGHQAEPRAALPVALAAPAILEATAGEDIPFALGLSDTSGLPARSIIAVRGLPRHGTFSAGRPHGEEGWYLRPEDIAGLRLTVPDDAQGDVTLSVNLITPGGEAIASAKTHLKVARKPAPSETVTAHGQDEHGLNRGVRSFATEAIDNPEAMLVFAGDTRVAPVSGPATEPPQTTGQPQTRTSNVTAAQPDNQDTAEAKDTAQAPVQPPADNDEPKITLSEFVNLRDGPSSSRRVIGVMEKGSTLRIIGRKRGWLNVTDVEGTRTGWIYSRYATSARRYRYAMRKAEPSRLGSPASESESDSSFFTRLGNWVVGP